jgi:hypothetical protein
MTAYTVKAGHTHTHGEKTYTAGETFHAQGDLSAFHDKLDRAPTSAEGAKTVADADAALVEKKQALAKAQKEHDDAIEDARLARIDADEMDRVGARYPGRPVVKRTKAEEVADAKAEAKADAAQAKQDKADAKAEAAHK